jgi:deoxyribose-phosphate aldolase
MEQNIGIKELARMIDHSLLHTTMTDEDIIAGCELASKYGMVATTANILEEVKRRGYQ